jgi:hypothetical protein
MHKLEDLGLLFEHTTQMTHCCSITLTQASYSLARSRGSSVSPHLTLTTMVVMSGVLINGGKSRSARRLLISRIAPTS